VPGIHVFLFASEEDVDGRDEPRHDEAFDIRDVVSFASSRLD